jgi:hypothetical protein
MQPTTFSPAKNHAQNAVFRKTPSKNHKSASRKKYGPEIHRTPRLG